MIESMTDIEASRRVKAARTLRVCWVMWRESVARLIRVVGPRPAQVILQSVERGRKAWLHPDESADKKSELTRFHAQAIFWEKSRRAAESELGKRDAGALIASWERPLDEDRSAAYRASQARKARLRWARD